MPIELIHGACPHDCPDTCGIVTEVENGRAVNFYADADHPVTQGWLCAKVRPYLERVYHPDRLTYPLRHVGPKGGGQWARITWDEAIGEIAARWRAIAAEHGAAAILPYSYSGTLGLVQMAVSSARLWNRLGASRLQRSICGAAAELAVESTLGLRHSPAYDDLAHSRLIILWGHNPASTAPHVMPALRAAQRAGAELIVIDPRRTRSAHGADLHLAPIPGTDGALALGLAHVIVQDGQHDEAWLQAHTVGWPQLKARLADYPPARVAQITSLPAETIVALARRYAGVRPGLIKIADGINRHANGGQTVRAICALPAITGQYGIRGGGLAYSTSGTLRWDSEAVNHWAACPPPARSVNMNRLGAALLGEVSDPPIRSLYVFGSNPAAIAPNAGAVVAGLRRDDLFTVVHELFMTDTADLADIVLPATSQLEHSDLHKAYGHTYVQYNPAAIPPLGESKSNWDVMRLLAQALGFNDPWLRQSADEVIKEILAATAAGQPGLQGITLARLQEGQPLPLTMASTTPFADLHFPTPSGKVELFSQTLADQGLDPLPGYVNAGDDAAPPDGYATADALQLISGAAHHFVTSSLANLDSLLARESSPFLEIHPVDAEARRITQGDIVIVENRRGWCSLRAVVTEAVRPGVVVSPKGRWSRQGNGRNVNWTTPDALGDMAGQSTFHSNRVWVRPAHDASAPTLSTEPNT
ncbi:molybdopterin-containing oxidoreductase family protein [Candidatus Amarolinea aalborgensis]|uniref:molybdopterin-containing oxidoreductase family protein n=1 Tax=Candidatus Amarolinea aalborgensis TaxID=2249329 RepID=UPI003BFA1F60